MRGHAEGYGTPDIASLMRALMGATGELQRVPIIVVHNPNV
jgi:hypothetical protein